MSKNRLQVDDDHPDGAPSNIEQIVNRATSRRGILRAGAAAIGLFLAARPLTRAIAAADDDDSGALLGFEAVPASTADAFIVPRGYRAEPLISWGDPILRGAPEFDPSGTQPAAAQAGQFGDNNDGMSLFPLSADRALLAVNNEYTNYLYLFDDHRQSLDADGVRKSQAAHGVSIFEIARRGDGGWRYLPDSTYNRRITAFTRIELSGPAAGHALLRTSADPAGRTVLGTFNNCANGQTPWGTYLSCEENFHGYFAADDPGIELSAAQRRYGLRAGNRAQQWYRHDERFDLASEPNEANRHGWVVEIDPYDPGSTPRKRTALGRFKHENAALTINGDGCVVVYMGDDERGEHLYRFVSNGRYNPDDQAANRDLLDQGTLYVARFDARQGELRGSGVWLELVHGRGGLDAEHGFPDQATVLIHAREAATRVGATTMDRPEWVAVHPHDATVLCSLTNNRNRGKSHNQPVGGPNPRRDNKYGQIVRWRPQRGDHTAQRFDWDLLVIAGNPEVHPGTPEAGSANVNRDNMFNSPDGLGFDAAGRLWIQTDGNYSNEGDFAGMGNNQMLCADPASGEIRRFLTGPIACEITGLTFSPDQRTMFVGVQHPGKSGRPSHFPGGGKSKPRSTIMVVRRNDGGVIGS